MSEVLEEMTKLLLRHPRKTPTVEAAQVALFLANAAWNESVGLGGSRERYRNVWETIQARNPKLWNEFKSNNINGMIDELIQYKKSHNATDGRRILTCGIADGKIRVEWLGPAAPGVDSRWEMQLYGLVRAGKRQEAIRFLQQTRAVSRREAEGRVAEIIAPLGVA
jgi:hypothetical protein